MNIPNPENEKNKERITFKEIMKEIGQSEGHSLHIIPNSFTPELKNFAEYIMNELAEKPNPAYIFKLINDTEGQQNKNRKNEEIETRIRESRAALLAFLMNKLAIEQGEL